MSNMDVDDYSGEWFVKMNIFMGEFFDVWEGNWCFLI